MFNSRLSKEVLRTGLLLVLASVLLYVSTYHLPDPALGPILTTSAILVFVSSFSHLTRRIVLPSINTGELLAEVKKGNMAAAVVVVGVFYVFIQLVHAGVALLR